MSVHEKLSPPSETPHVDRLVELGAKTFEDYSKTLSPLHRALDCIDRLGDIDAVRAAGKIRRDLDRFEPSVTMIGQIKSGKTTLVNAMIGKPDLLPADVNPWTSVVTSVHMCTRALTPPTRAKFRFFDNDEWDRLVKGGGRIGELANRAGAEDELSKILAQAEAMRENARLRLGRKFELLLGSEQNYGYFDKALVERYVCLGDRDEQVSKLKKSKGFFADITKSADLFMQQAALPINLCIRDTPGVNDTFMVREQITIKAIRDSRICVVVLSAHQALSSTDMALVRLISTVKSREIVIFINRIDELADPRNEVQQIRDSVTSTLATHNGPEDVSLVFGSALWAQMAAHRSLSELPKASLSALFNWAETLDTPPDETSDPHELLWLLSGVPSLMQAIAVRVAEGEGRELATRNRSKILNLLNRILASDNLDEKARHGGTTFKADPHKLRGELESIKTKVLSEFDEDFSDVLQHYHHRVDQAHETFLARATEDLAKHLEIYGEGSPWSYDPAGLRILLQSSYKIFGAKAQTSYRKSAKDAAQLLQDLVQMSTGLDPSLYSPRFPEAPHTPPPIAIGQTIALDLRGRWWKNWWQRRQDYVTQAQRFQHLVRAETQQLITDLKSDQADLVHKASRAELENFLDEQIANILMLANDNSKSAITQILGLDDLKAREVELRKAITSLVETEHAL